MARITYQIEIQNDYIGKYKRITGRTPREVEMKAAEQLYRWSQEEEKARARAAVADEKVLAQQRTDEALSLIEEYRGILNATLPVDDRISWPELKDRKRFPHAPPALENVVAGMNVPEKRPLMEKLRPSLTERRESMERAAQQHFEKQMKKYEAARESFLSKQKAHNSEVEDFLRGYKAGERDRVEEYVSLVLANSAYPEGFPREFSVQFLPGEKEVIVDVEVPSPDAMPKVVEYKYVQTRRVTNEVYMKDKDFQPFYDDVIHQTVLRTLHEVFEGDYVGNCQTATVNGWVQGCRGRVYLTAAASS